MSDFPNLSQYFLPYIEKHWGYKLGEQIRCLDPDHDDKHPSMKVYNNSAYCHGCQSKLNVFDLASIRKDNVTFYRSIDKAAVIAELAKELDAPELQDSHTSKHIETYNLYESVATMIADTKVDKSAYTKDAVDWIKSKGWNKETLQEFRIGCLTSQHIQSTVGLDATLDPLVYLASHDLYRSHMGIFNKGNVIFPLENDRGKVCGFSARDVLWTRGKETPKYITTSGKIPIFKKNDILYSYYRARKVLMSGDADTIYVVEGQGDVITLWQHGLKTAISTCTSKLSEHQAYLIKRSGATKVVFCFDGDEAGREGLIKALENYLPTFTGIRIECMEVEPGEDPDSFVQQHGLEKFLAQPTIAAFEYLLKHSKHKDDPDKLAEYLVPFIASYSSPIERERLCKRVALACDLSSSTMLEAVNSIVYETENNNRNKVKAAAEDFFRNVQKNPDTALAELEKARIFIENVESEEKLDHFSGSYFAQQVTGFKAMNENNGEGFPGYKMPMMPELAEAFNNDWSKGNMIGLGGLENSGKTSFSCFLTSNLIIDESENDVRAIYMTIDDSVMELYRKYVCILGKYYTRGGRYPDGFNLEINHVVRPKYWSKVLRDTAGPQVEKDMIHAYNVGYAKLTELANRDKLMIIGIPDARNVTDLERAMKKLRKKYPDDNLFAFLDNIHKLPPTQSEARLFFTEMSNRIKNASVEHGFAVGGTLEYNSSAEKRGKDSRPTNESIAEARGFKYDANALIHMYSHLHVKGEESPWYHWQKDPWNREPKKRPLVEAIIGKNKISDDKMPHFFKFFPASSWFEYTDRREAIQQALNNEEEVKTRSSLERSDSNAEDDDTPVFDNTNFGIQDKIRLPAVRKQ